MPMLVPRLPAIALTGALALGALAVPAIAAQDATPAGGQTAEEQAPGYPSHVHEGTCENLDPAPLYGLANVVFERTREKGGGQQASTSSTGTPEYGATSESGQSQSSQDMGQPAGTAAAIPVAVATTVLDVPLSDLTSGNRALNVHSDEDISQYIACGDIAGEPDADGNLFIGLRELNGSGFSGVVWLLGTDGQTTVTVFLANGINLSGAQGASGTQGMATLTS